LLSLVCSHLCSHLCSRWSTPTSALTSSLAGLLPPLISPHISLLAGYGEESHCFEKLGKRRGVWCVCVCVVSSFTSITPLQRS
jgi:hypothetical protein